MLSRSSIDEANRHLYAMHQQIISLEEMVQQQNQALLDRDHQIALLEKNKNQEIQTLKNQVHRLEEEVEVRDTNIESLKEGVDQLQSVLQFLPCVRGLLKEMEHSAGKTQPEKSLTNHTDNHMDEVTVNHSNGESPGNTDMSNTSNDKEFYF